MKLHIFSANQTEITIGDTVVFFSYETPVAILKDGIAYITDKKFSQTTSGHINQWLYTKGMSKAEATVKPQEFFDNFIDFDASINTAL